MRKNTGKIAEATLTIGISIGLTAPALGQIQIRTYPAETFTTEAQYDTASRNLQVRCVSASQGICRVFVKDKGVERTVSLRPGRSATFTQLSSNAQSCTLGKNPTTVCTWQRISPVE